MKENENLYLRLLKPTVFSDFCLRSEVTSVMEWVLMLVLPQRSFEKKLYMEKHKEILVIKFAYMKMLSP